MKLFFLMLIFSVSCAFTESKFDPEKYRLYVTEVDPEFHCFALSNGMTCYTIKLDWQLEKLPEVGTEIYLSPWSNKPKCVSSDNSRALAIQKGEFYVSYSIAGQKRGHRVWMPREFEQYCLAYISTKSVSTQPVGKFVNVSNRLINPSSQEFEEWLASA
jgi:hypothetical protein